MTNPSAQTMLEQIADCDNPEMMRGLAKKALAALRATSAPAVVRLPGDEKIAAAIIKQAGKLGDINIRLTYESGPYDITRATSAATRFVSGVLSILALPEVDDLEYLVQRFSKALLAKLKLARANGRSGWDRADWENECQQGLLRHLAKGDPRDVAAYCAFMWHHGWITLAAPPAAQTDGVTLSSTQSAIADRNLVESLCDDCPPVGYETDKTRCLVCPRRSVAVTSTDKSGAA